MDKAGRLVVPKALRDAVGLISGEVEVTQDGGGVRIEPVSGRGTTQEKGRLVIDGPIDLDDSAVRSLRLIDQR